MLSFPDRERLASEPDARVSERATDEERCTSVGRACLGLLGTSTSLASLLEAIPRLLADGLGLAGVAIRLGDAEPMRAVTVRGLDEPFSAAIRDAPLAPHAPGTGVGPGFWPPPALRRLGSLQGEEASLYGVEVPTTEGPWGMLYLLSAQPPSAAVERLVVDLGAALGHLVSREHRELQLRQRIQAREEALGIVAHDLRNPIGAISVAASGLLQRLTDASTRRPVERIQRAAKRVEKLLHDLLDIHAIEGGRFSLSKGWVSPTRLILSALDSQQNLAGDSSVIIGTDIAPDLGALEIDHERILQVLENLIGNALKFTPPGGSVTVGATAAEPGFVRFTVKDTGSGIDPEEVPHIFTWFWRGQRSGHRGTGLGLAICKAIIEAHGGRIWAESPPGAGALLHFTLPATLAEPGLEGPAEEPAAILLVDDTPENLVALKAILAHPSYRLVTATSGEEALKLALRERFAVALIDVAMPGMNGFEVAEHLQTLERSRHMPIIFVTAFGNDPQEVHRAYAAGGADYLVKPMDPEIVRKKVAVFVELGSKRAEPGPP